MDCDKSRIKVRNLMSTIKPETKYVEEKKCNCKVCIRCFTAWIEDMEIQMSERKVKSDSHFVATFGEKAATTQQVKEDFRWLNTPQVEASCSQMFYNDYVAKLCYTLEMLELDTVTTILPDLPSMTLDKSQLELSNVLDEYVREQVKEGGRLLSLLTELAGELQRYGNGDHPDDIRTAQRNVITKSQAFMLNYRDMQREKRNVVIPEFIHLSKHKKYRDLVERVCALKKSIDEPSRPTGGDNSKIDSIYKCGPYCTCVKCRKYVLYNSNTVSNKQGDCKGSSNSSEVSVISDLSVTSDTITSDIEVNSPYHKVIKSPHGGIHQGRKCNRDDTAGVEQRLLPPNIASDHPRLSATNIYSEFDDKVVVSRNLQSKFQTNQRRSQRLTKTKPHVLHWRMANRATVGSNPTMPP